MVATFALTTPDASALGASTCSNEGLRNSAERRHHEKQHSTWNPKALLRLANMAEVLLLEQHNVGFEIQVLLSRTTLGAEGREYIYHHGLSNVTFS